MLIFIMLIFSLQILADSMCFIHQPPGKEDLHQIASRKDCIEVARLMIKGDKAYAPMLFTRKEGIGFQVPHTWALKGTCFISIDMMEEDDEETFTLAKMAVIVATIIHDCVDNPAFDRLGGQQKCGPHRRIMLIVAGKDVDTLKFNITMANPTLARLYRTPNSSPQISNFSESILSGPKPQAVVPW